MVVFFIKSCGPALDPPPMLWFAPTKTLIFDPNEISNFDIITFECLSVSVRPWDKEFRSDKLYITVSLVWITRDLSKVDFEQTCDRVYLFSHVKKFFFHSNLVSNPADMHMGSVDLK